MTKTTSAKRRIAVVTSAFAALALLVSLVPATATAVDASATTTMAAKTKAATAKKKTPTNVKAAATVASPTDFTSIFATQLPAYANSGWAACPAAISWNVDTTGLTAPFKASYAYGVATEIGIFTQALPERFLRLEGINTAQGNAKVLVELYRVAFDPLKEISFISDEYNKFELEGSLLADTTKPFDAVLGQFGRIVQL